MNFRIPSPFSCLSYEIFKGEDEPSPLNWSIVWINLYPLLTGWTDNIFVHATKSFHLLFKILIEPLIGLVTMAISFETQASLASQHCNLHRISFDFTSFHDIQNLELIPLFSLCIHLTSDKVSVNRSHYRFAPLSLVEI